MARDCKLEYACRTKSTDPCRSCLKIPCCGQPGLPAGSWAGQAGQVQHSRSSKAESAGQGQKGKKQVTMARDCKLEYACRTKSTDPCRSCLKIPCCGQPGLPAGSRTRQAEQPQHSRASKAESAGQGQKGKSRPRRAEPPKQWHGRASRAE